jgi:hypothetical protein
VLLIGAGALGSVVAELLVRGGVRSLCVLDGETLEAGNLVRHALSLDDLGQNKAMALAARLNGLSPHVEVHAAPINFGSDLPEVLAEVRSAVADAELVIDCTASDSALAALHRFDWQRERVFACLGLGPYARRLYCFLTRGSGFPRADYIEAIDPWLKVDWQGLDESEFPREGVGCWHPLMPASAAGVWLFAATAVRFLESSLGQHLQSGSSCWAVFEQVEQGGTFAGIRRLSDRPP